jgi:hypothetical protein
MFYYCGAVSEQCAARCIAATGELLINRTQLRRASKSADGLTPRVFCCPPGRQLKTYASQPKC